MNGPIFEIRLPTYNRPQMLRRAIDSLLRQTYPYWRAIVFDDSTSAEARDVVQCADDNRIAYKRNPIRMGAAGNIDQCFSPQAMRSGHYGCLLEDDNYWLPGFLSEVRTRIAKADVQLVLANQRINDEEMGLQGKNSTTRGEWFSDGSVSPLFLRASLLLMEGISNGGLVWRLEDKLDLRVGPKVEQAGLQEACRSLLVRTPFLFISEPLAVWTSVPKSNSARAQETNRLFGRGMQSIRSFVLRRHGRYVVDMARPIAQKLGLSCRLLGVLSYCGYPHLAGELLRGRISTACTAVAKGMAIRVIQSDPCASFVASLADASV
jgi:glycosyltransferase involved in cell wall biosynthesis